MNVRRSGAGPFRRLVIPQRPSQLGPSGTHARPPRATWRGLGFVPKRTALPTRSARGGRITPGGDESIYAFACVVERVRQCLILLQGCAEPVRPKAKNPD